ncbi:MAG: ribonuclease HII [Patescibacteria group bacterium]
MRFRCAIGIDEVGRGPLAGPLCVGACLARIPFSLQFSQTFSAIRDSKQLTGRTREEWFCRIAKAAEAGECQWSTVCVSEKVIDRRGLSYALRKAINTVLKRLGATPELSDIFLDGGIKAPHAFPRQWTIIRGDEKVPLIAGASIMAKVRRDRYMVRLARRYPLYGFEKHKGYGTKTHYEALRRHGPCEIHRRSFLRGFRVDTLSE